MSLSICSANRELNSTIVRLGLTVSQTAGIWMGPRVCGRLSVVVRRLLFELGSINCTNMRLVLVHALLVRVDVLSRSENGISIKRIVDGWNLLLFYSFERKKCIN